MKKLLLCLLPLLLVVFGWFACLPPGGQAENPAARALTPQVVLKTMAGCPNMARLSISYSLDFGAARTVEIYQATKNQPFVKIATLAGTATSYVARPLVNNMTYYYYVSAQRVKDNLWYKSATNNVITMCSTSSSSASSTGSSSTGSTSSSTSSTGSSSSGSSMTSALWLK